MSALVPVTVIGGFLGAGKTTLLNRILAAQPTRTAVLVNDFGDINVDMALVTSDNDLTFELSGGCICCSMAEGVGPAIASALATNPETILIEASGVGEPRRVAEFALLDRRLRLDMIVTLANAVALADQVDDPLIGDTVARQFDGADLIVLNHSDAATPARLAGAHALLRRLAPGRRVIETVQSDLPMDLLTTSTHAIFGAGPLGEAGTDHARLYARSELATDVPMAREALKEALGALPDGVLRLKGWVRLVGEPTPQLLQYVAGRWTLSPAPDGPPDTMLVAIATLPDFDLSAALRRAEAPAH